ncbi:hypothetical protein P5Z58_09530, partial [Limosilactobacillus mucosae]|nr:hypothetical protein [Limosilactobacillus mucosae]
PEINSWTFDKNASSELNNLGNIEGKTGEYSGLLIDASKAGAKFSPRDTGDTQINANTVISIPVKANQYGAKITIELSGGTVDLTTNQGSQTGLKGTFTLTIPAMAADGYFAITFNSVGYLKLLKLDYQTAPEEYPGIPVNVSAKDTEWNLSNDTSRPTVQNTRGEYSGLKIDGTDGKFSPRTSDTQVNGGTIIYIPIAADVKGAKVTISGIANGQTIMLDGQNITLGQAINVDASSAHYLKLLVSGTGSAYLTNIAVDYGSDTTNDFPGVLPTGKAEDTSWDLAQANDRPSAEKSTASYN